MARHRDRNFAAFLTAGGDAWNYTGPLSDDVVAALPAPATGNRIKYDAKLKGFGVRVTAAGAKAFVLNYRSGRRERRPTIGSYPDWPAEKARDQAAALKRRVDQGEDPMAERHADRAAPTVNDLADRFEAEHLPKKRPGTQEEYRRPLRQHVRPALGKRPVADIQHADIEALHQRLVQRTPYAANRAVAVLSKMFSLAVKWGMRADNPVKGIERAPEEKRERYLTPAEIARLSEVLATHSERSSANAIKLLLLTGARRGEVLGATWDQFDLTMGVWIKPSSLTKQARTHRVPLSAPALALLSELKTDADARRSANSAFLFPGRRRGSGDAKPLQEIKNFWRAACKQAGIGDARIHDLRHTYASILASRGLSLPIIGSLLGHSQAATTHRYAHLMDDPLRVATEAAGAFITGTAGEKPQAEVVPHPAAARVR